MSKPKTKKTRGVAYDSMDQAAVGMGLPKDFLQEAKALGAPGFRGSRVYADQVQEWVDGNPLEADSSLLGLRKKYLRARTSREEHLLQIARGEHLPVAEIVSTISVLVSEFNGHIRVIEDSLPQAMQGLGLPEQKLVVRKQFDGMRAKIHAPFVKYEKALAKQENR